MDLIISYKWDEKLPEDKLRAWKIICEALRYTIIDGVIYRQVYTLPFI